MVARLIVLGIARLVVKEGVVNVGATKLVTLVVGGTMVVFGLVKVMIELVKVLVKVSVKVSVKVGPPGSPIVIGGGGGPVQIFPMGQQPPPSQTVL